MNVFDCAIKMEQEARMLYEKLAKDTSVPELNNLFTLLAESEQEHHDALLKLKGNYIPLKIKFKELQGSACLFKPLLARRDLANEPIEDSDAYQRIVKEEEKGVQFSFHPETPDEKQFVSNSARRDFSS